jgi:predicted DNA-binding WGR domain protein
MGPLHFEQIDPHRNRARFYRLEIRLTLFGETVLVKAWGRVGTDGQQRELPVRDSAGALAALELEARKRLRRGYRPVDPAFAVPPLSGAL